MRRRGQETTDAILRTAVDVLVERGYGALTMDAVADAAGASKATLYRRWDNKLDLVLAALKIAIDPPTVRDLGSVSLELNHQYRQRLGLYSSDRGRRLIAILIGAAATDERLASALKVWLTESRRGVAAIIERGQDRGEVRTDVALESLITLASSALIHRAVVEQVPPDEALVSDVVLLLEAAMAPVTSQERAV